MLGWGVGNMLPEADSNFDGIDRQLFLALPGQHEIDNVVIATVHLLLISNWLAPTLHVCLAFGLFVWAAR
jgi:hypothetical protein